jgi:hypothetical protein
MSFNGLLTLIVFCGVVVLFIRTIQVYHYRGLVRDEMLARDLREIEWGGEGWRGDVIRQVSFSRMIWMFWRTPGSFYDFDHLRRPNADAQRVS